MSTLSVYGPSVTLRFSGASGLSVEGSGIHNIIVPHHNWMKYSMCGGS